MSDQLTVIRPGCGELAGNTPQRRVEILSERPPLHATLSRFAAGEDGAALHIHREHTDCFYVLEGELTVRLGVQDEHVTLPAGSFAWVPPGVVHGFRNASGAAESHLNFHAPGTGFIQYLRGLRDGTKVAFDQYDPPADGGRPITDAVVTSGDGVLADLGVLRAERPRGATGPRTLDVLASYWVLDGAATITVGAEEIAALAGTWLQVPPGREHAVDGDVLVITAPLR